MSPTRNHPRMSPTATSPTSTRKPVPTGFVAYKPKQKPIPAMNVRELTDHYARNVSILSAPYVLFIGDAW